MARTAITSAHVRMGHNAMQSQETVSVPMDGQDHLVFKPVHLVFLDGIVLSTANAVLVVDVII
jgi:hypothetical protein